MSLLPRSFYLDDIFEDFGRMPVPKYHDMKCDIYESNGNYNIEMDIPGYDKKDITIECEDGILTISAEKNNESEEKDEDKKYIRRERVYGKISRTFNFTDIDEEAINAEFDNGILKVTVPKTTKKETKRVIEIN